MTRALVVDDHPLVCEALQLAVLSAAPELTVHSANTVAAMEKHARAEREYRLVALDLVLPDAQGFSGLVAAKRLFPQAAVALISAREDGGAVRMAAALGAAGYLFKAWPLGRMQDSFKRLLAGEQVFPPLSDDGDADTEARRIARALAALSPAQLRILTALANGQANKMIAHELSITEATVKSHMTQLFRAFDVTNRSQLILAAGPALKAAQGAVQGVSAEARGV